MTAQTPTIPPTFPISIVVPSLPGASGPTPTDPDYPVIFVKWGGWNHEIAQRAGMLPSWPVIVEMEEEHWKEEYDLSRGCV